MILLDQSPLEAVSASTADGSIRELVDDAWHNDVALEMWIDVTTEPVAIRLAGVLDVSTGANLFNVIADCLDQGQRDFNLDTGELRMEATGWQVMERIRRQIDGAGGHLYWDHHAPACERRDGIAAVPACDECEHGRTVDTTAA